jgi:hypothetical protein
MNTAAISVALVLFVQGAFKLDPPPPPDFKTPVDYAAWFERQVIRGQSKDDNAADLYAAIFGQVDAEKPAPDGFNGPRTGATPAGSMEPWDPKKKPEWEAAYQKNKSKIDQFKRAAAKPYAWWGIRYGNAEPPHTLLQLYTSELAKMRLLAKGVSENAWRAENGKLDEAEFVAIQRAILAEARQIERNPSAIAQLVGYAIRWLAYDDLLRAAELGALSDKQRSAVLLLLTARDEAPPPFAYAMNSEMALSFDVIQAIAMKSGGKFGVDGKEGITLKGNLPCDAPKARDAMKAYYESLAKESAAPYSTETITRMSAAEETAKSADKFCEMMVPALSRAYELRLRCEALRRGTRLVVEILVYNDKNKKWPASLNDLPGEVPKAAKIDPFSEKPFVYRLEDGKPLLYSVAKDGKDDGGTKHDKKWGDDADHADYIIWPRPKD